jgi:hypothetical protein
MKLKLNLFYFFLFTTYFSFSQTIDSLSHQTRKFNNLKEKYSSEDFNYNEKISDVNSSAWERFWRAVEHFFEQLFNFGNSAKTLSGLELLMRILAVLIILFVIYMIVKIIINKEGGWIFSSSERKIKVTDDVIENIHTIDFKTIINNALHNNNYRLAIRYYYLWLLKSLSDKGAIEWDIEKTNSDYLSEIQSEDLKKDFRFLSYVYEYSWYGEFEINDTDFSKTETAFLKLISK